MRRTLLAVGLVLLFLLHNDFWNWNRPTLILGLPAGLLYHVIFCVVVAVYMAVLLRFSKPAEPQP